MCLLLETIKLQNGVLENLYYHNLRMNAAREELFRTASSIDRKSTRLNSSH
jgi:4-amino-4-deoxychorismate lyase